MNDQQKPAGPDTTDPRAETLTTRQIMERYDVSRAAIYKWREWGLEPHGWDLSGPRPARTYLAAEVEAFYNDPARTKHRKLSNPNH